jgi:hypothetical protein
MMAVTAAGADLQIGEHPRFEARWRFIQTLIFSLMVLLIIAGLAGISGAGPLATKRETVPGAPFVIEYPRFARTRAPERIIVRPHAVAAGQIVLHLDQELMDKLRIKEISPQPLASAIDESGIQFLFAVGPGANGTIMMQGQPGMPGIARGRISINGRERIFHQIIWP